MRANPNRHCFALDLVDDPELIAKYEGYHGAGKVWPEVTASIRSAGILEMQIWRTGNRLFMIVEADGTFDPEKKAVADAADPKVQEWETLMGRFQRSLPWAEDGVKWMPMGQIFSLGEH